MNILDDQSAISAFNHLKAHDPILSVVIERVGACTIRPNKDYYPALVDAIIGQQLSVAAARSIKNRFRDLFDGTMPSPEQILQTDQETLRGIGFSRAKASYVHDLAQHIVDDTVSFKHIDTLSNDEIVKELTAVKGIGEWTVHMFLMFCVGRMDVLPVGDLGIRNGVRALYGFEDGPTPQQIREVADANHWHPYESIASWYVWQSLNNAPTL